LSTIVQGDFCHRIEDQAGKHDDDSGSMGPWAATTR